MKRVEVSEEEVKLIIFALRHVVVPIEQEKAAWDLSQRLEQEMNK